MEKTFLNKNDKSIEKKIRNGKEREIWRKAIATAMQPQYGLREMARGKMFFKNIKHMPKKRAHTHDMMHGAFALGMQTED